MHPILLSWKNCIFCAALMFVLVLEEGDTCFWAYMNDCPYYPYPTTALSLSLNKNLLGSVAGLDNVHTRLKRANTTT